MRVCTLKDGQVIDKKGNVIYTLKSKRKGSQLTPEAALELLQVSVDLNISIITASQKPKEKKPKGQKESDTSETPESPRIYGHCRSKGSVLTPEDLELIKVYIEPAPKPIPINIEDWKKDSQEEDI